MSSHRGAIETKETIAIMAGVLAIEAAGTKVGEQPIIMEQDATHRSVFCVKETIGHKGVILIQQVS